MDTVADLMSTTVVTIPARASLVEAAQAIVIRDKGALPIVQGPRRRNHHRPRHPRRAHRPRPRRDQRRITRASPVAPG